MKFAVVLLAACIAAVSAQDVPKCSAAALLPIASSADAAACTAEADGFSLIDAKYPSPAQLPKLCASKACVGLLAALKKAAPTECKITLVTPNILLHETLLTPITKACDALSKPAPGPGPAPGPAPTTVVPGPAPVPTKPSPAC